MLANEALQQRKGGAKREKKCKDHRPSPSSTKPLYPCEVEGGSPVKEAEERSIRALRRPIK